MFHAHRRRTREKFTPEEDQRLSAVVREIGAEQWNAVADRMPGRNVRQCRDRWLNFLSPEVANEPWTAADDAMLVEWFCRFGPTWRRIARELHGRSEVSVKNRWQVIQRRARKEAARMEEPSPQSVAEAGDWASAADENEWDLELDGWPGI
jgi:hypothetical protein